MVTHLSISAVNILICSTFISTQTIAIILGMSHTNICIPLMQLGILLLINRVWAKRTLTHQLANKYMHVAILNKTTDKIRYLVEVACPTDTQVGLEGNY